MLNAFRNRGQPGEEQIDELLSAYLDGVLDLDERAMLEARLQEDRDLLARLNVLRQTKKALAQLPQVAVPRNFILSPSMAAAPKPAPPKMKRRTWPVFGWATAAVTLLFLLVFAGDVFVVAPSQRAEPTQIAAQQAPVVREAESLPDAEEEVSLGVQVTVEVEREEIVAPTNEKQAYVAEQEAPVEAPLPPAAGESETLVGESEAPVAEVAEEESVAEADEMRLQSATSATAEGAVESAKETAPMPATPTPGPAPTQALETRGAIVTATSPATAEVETAAPPVASPTALPEATQAEIGLETLPERAATPDAVAVLILTPDAAAGSTDTDDVRMWLRVAEFGLGLAVIGLALATLMVRRRES